VWCRALAGFSTFDPARGDFSAWIFGIARNLLIELMRHHARRGAASAAAFPLSQIADDATAISRRVCADEALAELSRIIASLDEADRDLVVWRGLEGLSHEVVAERFGLSRDAVMKRWQRLREDLRKRIPKGARLLDSDSET
jgi:RNA polymerase sigma-70 factor (ECF subfamily)